MRSIIRRIDSWIRRDSSMPGIAPRDLARTPRRPAARREIGEREQAGAQAVVDVVVVVGDVVGERGDLRLGPGKVSSSSGWRRSYSAIAGGTVGSIAGGPEQRAVVLDDAFQRLPGQVEPVELGVAAFRAGSRCAGSARCVEAAERRHRRVQRLLAGMAERRVAEIVGQRHRLGQILVEAERAGRCVRAICATSSVWVSRVR